MMTEPNDDILISIMTKTLQEYGLPEFNDNLPAMDILKLVKDAGYSRLSSPELEESYAKEFRMAYNGIISDEQIEASIRWNLDFIRKFIKPAPKPLDENKVKDELEIICSIIAFGFGGFMISTGFLILLRAKGI